MGLFNRYESRFQGLESAFWEGCDKYCNPADYSVSEEDCRKYLKDLEHANKLNDEWNEKRRSRWVWTTFIIGAILTNLIPTIVFLGLYKHDSAWAFPASLLVSWIIFGISAWIYNKVEEYFQGSKIYLSRFYPEVNENIEKLFDDYLWKCKLLKDSESKGKEEWEFTHDKIVRMSHPGLDDFKEAIETELRNPSEEFVFGDLKFGMTKEEIYNTKVFAGLQLDISNNDIHLGYRGAYLGSYFAIQCPSISFHLDNNRLVKSIICPDLSCENKEAIIEPFISCCEKLNQYYGNPCNLRRKFKGEGFELVPYDNAEFRVGKKSVFLHVEKSDSIYSRYILKLEFSIASTTSNRRDEGLNQSFDTKWFDELRKWYSHKESYSSGSIDDYYVPF